MCVQSFSCFLIFATPWTIVHPGPLSMRFFRQEYWSHFFQGIFPTQELNPYLLSWRQFLYHWATWEAPYDIHTHRKYPNLNSHSNYTLTHLRTFIYHICAHFKCVHLISCMHKYVIYVLEEIHIIKHLCHTYHLFCRHSCYLAGGLGILQGDDQLFNLNI